MQLPSAELAQVPETKLGDYLLSETHPIGSTKARRFRALGFDRSRADDLAQRLLAIAGSEDVVSVSTTPFGAKYIVDGMIEGAEGRTALVRTVWIIEAGYEHPRPVTAYPR